jgi:dTDP-4-amino-4,6-dideoxygalactose transaminase
MMSIPLLRPLLPDAHALLPYLQRIDSNRFYTNFGPLHQEFLQRLLTLQLRKEGSTIHGLLTTSATLGLELAIAALDLPAGSHVAVPALTFIATGTAIERCGHIPVAVDVDSQSWLLTPNQMPKGVELHDIKAVVPISTFGMPQDALAWSAWSQIHHIPVIIDAASAWGGQTTAQGVTAVFSLHATKALSSGEGGLILTRDPAMAERLRAMTNFGIGLNNPSMGSNAKMSEYHAALGLAHLEMWPAQVILRNNLIEKYHQALAPATSKMLTFQKDTGLFSPSLFCIRMNSQSLRDQLEAYCAAKGIQTRRWYLPLLQDQPMLKSVLKPWPTTHADDLAKTLIGLPFFVDMDDQQLEKVVHVVFSLGS